MKNKITLFVLAGFVVLIVCTVGVRRVVERTSRKVRLQKLPSVRDDKDRRYVVLRARSARRVLLVPGPDGGCMRR